MPRRPNAPALNEETVLTAALALVDEHGLDGLSMRRLGSALGVDPMAAYYYFPNKRALLRRLVEFVFRQLQAVERRGSWQERVLAWSNAYRALALSHPKLVLQIITDADAVSVAVPVANVALDEALQESGLAPGDVERARALVVDYVHGYVLGEAAVDGGIDVDGTSFAFALKAIIAGLAVAADESGRAR